MRITRLAGLIATSLLCGCTLLPSRGIKSETYTAAHGVTHASTAPSFRFGLSYSLWPQVNCALNTPCTTSGPSNTGTGDAAYVAFGKLNQDVTQLVDMFGTTSNLATNGSANATDIIGLWTGCSSSDPVLGYQGSCVAGGGSMTYPGAGLAYSGGSAWNTSVTTLAGLDTVLGVTLPTYSGTLTTGDLAYWSTGGSRPVLGDLTLGSGMSTFLGLAWPILVASDCLTNNGTVLSWGSCGSSGSSAFSALTGGTNTSAAMLVGTGASLGPTGTGTVSANEVNGATVPASANCTGTNSNGQLTGACPEPVATPVTGSTLTVTTALCGEQQPLEASGGVAVTLPGGSTFDGCQIDFAVPSGYGSSTITGSSVTIGGNSSITMAANSQCGVNFDGTNWQVIGCTALSSGGGGSGTVNSGTAGQLAYYGATGTAVSGTADVSLSAGTLTLGAASSVGGSIKFYGTGTGVATLSTSDVNDNPSVTIPDASGPLAVTSDSQSYSGTPSFNGGLFTKYVVMNGTTFTLGASTGACATSSSLTGGETGGSFECTGSAGASTFTLTLPSATHGWSCWAHDITTGANILEEGANSATTDTFSGTVDSDDVIRFGCVGY